MKHDFHAHHAPMGAYGSFLLGLNGAPGGFVAGQAGEGAQDVFVGYRYAGEAWTLLPFVRETTAHAAGSAVSLLPNGRYGRTLGWASDRWMAQALVFSIATPFESIDGATSPDWDQMHWLMAPAAYALLDFDNSHMDVPVDLVFAIGDATALWRRLEVDGLAGWMDGAGSAGFAAPTGVGGRAFDDDAVLGVRAAGLIFQISPAAKAVFPIALGFGARAADVLPTALGQFAEARALALRRDDELRAAALPDDVRRTVALATRAHLAGTPVGSGGIDLSLARMCSLGSGASSCAIDGAFVANTASVVGVDHVSY